jgi:hypothetical protein
MFERFRRRSPQETDARTDTPAPGFTPGDGYDGNGRSATGDTRTAVIDRPPATTTAARPATIDEARAVQRERFGGADGTAIFFGWLSALGLAALLMAVVAAAGTRLGFATGVSTGDATGNAATIGIVGAAVLVAILLLAYYAGGYVAGRMSRFDGARQGFGVWVIGLVVTLAIAAAGAVLGDQYNVFDKLNLPRIPVNASDLTTGGAIALAAIVVGSLLAAVAGGKVGERYHRRVDRAALIDR